MLQNMAIPGPPDKNHYRIMGNLVIPGSLAEPFPRPVRKEHYRLQIRVTIPRNMDNWVIPGPPGIGFEQQHTVEVRRA